MIKKDIEIKEALQIAVCYTHFLSLLFNDRKVYRIKKVLGEVVLGPFERVWQKHKSSLINN